MDLARTGQIVLIMLSPTLVIGAAIYAPRVIKAVRQAFRPPPDESVSRGQPIERLAADLRRLLLMHDELRHSPESAMRGRRLQAIEAAITDCAVDAASALGLRVPSRPVHAGLAGAELKRLLRDVAGAGLVLPDVDLMTNGHRH
jgi:hypothetical protein